MFSNSSSVSKRKRIVEINKESLDRDAYYSNIILKVNNYIYKEKCNEI